MILLMHSLSDLMCCICCMCLISSFYMSIDYLEQDYVVRVLSFGFLSCEDANRDFVISVLYPRTHLP